MAIRLRELASRLDASAGWLGELDNAEPDSSEPDSSEIAPADFIDHLASPRNATRSSLSFLFDPTLANEAGRAGAVIVEGQYACLIPRPFIVDKPLVALARAYHWLPILRGSGHLPVGLQAKVSNQASVHPSSSIGPDVVLGEGSSVAANATLAGEVRVGSFCEIGANVSIKGPVTIGNRVQIDANSTIGGEPFMYIEVRGHWLKVPSFNGVQIQDDADIGAGTTIDRGMVDDTIIGAGVKLDPQVHIGHGAKVGQDTIIAGKTTVAGEVTIGKGCKIGGACAISEGVTVADSITLLGMSAVTRSLMQRGEYTSAWPVQRRSEWWKQLATLKKMAKRFRSNG